MISPIFVVFAAVFVPLAMILFGLNLSALSVAFKWAVAGHVVPGVHKWVYSPSFSCSDNPLGISQMKSSAQPRPTCVADALGFHKQPRSFQPL